MNGTSATSASLTQRCSASSQTALGYFDRRPRHLVDAGDRGGDARWSSGRSRRTRPWRGSRCRRRPTRSRPSPPAHRICPVTPAARAVLMAWASNLPAPVAEAVLPLRSRARAITGAASRRGDRGELDVQPAHPGVAVRGALLGVAVDLADGVVDIDERDPVGRHPGEQPRHPIREPRQQLAADRVELLDVPVGERAQERAQRRGRPHPGEQPRPSRRAAAGRGHRCSPRRRASRRPRRSVFAAAFGEATLKSCSRRSYSPADSANRSTGTRPAADTRFGSSKTGGSCEKAFTYEVPLWVGRMETSQSTSSLLKGHSRSTPRSLPAAGGGSGFS